MNTSVDLTNLHEMTNGDAALEKELFAVFINESKTLVDGLAAAADATAYTEWRYCAHALKGISRNLGAVKLAELCYEAQMKHETNREEKAALLASIIDEYDAVMAFLQTRV